jgi:hypothetical protein
MRKHRDTKKAEAEERNAHTPPERRKANRGKECPSGKQVLHSEKEAQAELVGAMVKKNSGNNRRRECRFYHCPLCGYWHLTSKPLLTLVSNKKEES